MMMKKNSAAVMSAAISLIVMLLASSQATLTFAADMNEPVMANSPVAPRTDTMIKSVVNGVTTPPDKIQLATWDNTLLESNARAIENDMARRTELEEASSASGGVEATNGQEGTYVRGASKPPMAYGVPLEIGPNGVGSKDNGTHYQLFDGAHIWKMTIDAPQATSLTIHFSVFYIPQCADGACDLFIYSNEGTTLYYTHDDIRPDRKFVTPPIHGDRVTIEYYERFSHDPPMRLHITSVMQGFRDVSVRSASSTTGETSTSMSMVPRLQDVYNITDDQDGVIAKGPHGDSGLCNNDITCQLGDSFDKERRAVVQILTGGTSGQAVCTGTLLNTQDSTKQYVITAHHCLGDSGGQSVDYWGFLFNYERECSRFAAPRRFDEFVQGARLLFADRPSDTILLEITSPIPSHYRPYYQGWDAEVDNMPQSSFAIHHPSGDYKKISHDRHRSSLTTCTFCGRVPNTHFLVSGWDDGTTERGSSGCGLLDATTRRLVAVLSGGSASCPDNNGYDFFGRLSRAYDSGLGRWLMPVNTGVRKMDARDGSSTYAVNSVASSTPAMTADRLLALSPDGSGAGVVTTEGGSAGLVQVKLNAWPEGARTVEVIVATSDTTEGQVSCMGMAGGLALSDTSVRLSDESTLAAQLGGTTFSERCTLRFTSSTYTMPQAVRVVPMRDGTRDGDMLYSITFTVRLDPSSMVVAGVRTLPAQNIDEDDREGESLRSAIDVPSPIPSWGWQTRGSTSGYRNKYSSKKCELGTESPDIVYRYVPASNEYLDADVCQFSSYDTTLYIFEGNESNEVGCNDDGGSAACGRYRSALSDIPLTAGRTYYIVVDGYAGSQGLFALTLRTRARQGGGGQVLAAALPSSSPPAAAVAAPVPQAPPLATTNVPSVASNAYHGYAAVTRALALIARRHPETAKLYSIGRSALGRDLWVLQVTTNNNNNNNNNEARLPRIRLVGGVHGDEPSSVEVLLRFADRLATSDEYEKLRSSAVVDVLVSANPDGLESRTRANGRGVDLNRDFPLRDFNDDSASARAFARMTPAQVASKCSQDNRAPETCALLKWARARSHRAGLSLHAGALVVNTPWDACGTPRGMACTSPDDALYLSLGRAYANEHGAMASSRQFAGGVTNGAAWYPASGTLQDALYASTGALELTIEVSDTKAPSAHQLDRMAADHERALSGFVMRAAGASGALAGRVVDAATNAGIPGAVVTVNNGVPILVGDDGTYHKALLPGDYSVRVSAPGYAPGTRTVRVIGPVSQYAIALPIATADFALGKVSSVEVESSGEMGVEVQGTCRSLTVRVTNATPNGRVVIARGPGGRAGGSVSFPTELRSQMDNCAWVRSAVGRVRGDGGVDRIGFKVVTAGADGSVSVNQWPARARWACRRMRIQVVDLESCENSGGKSLVVE